MIRGKRERDEEEGEELGLFKKASVDPRSNTEYEPTRVLFVRGLSPTASERDVIDTCAEVGVVEQIFLLRNKGQAFIEFDSQEAADFCLLHYSANPVALQGNRLFFSYSGRHQVTRKPHEQPQPNEELVLTITDAKFPVTLDVVHKVMTPYGKALKVRIFPRSHGFQILIQMENLEAASRARAGLDGQHIYSGCNLIKAEYSPMAALAAPKTQEPDMNEEDFSNVIFLHNMSETLTPDMLFNLFSLYGNVQKVKIFYKKRDMGLVQFEDHEQAVMAKNNLHNLPLLGRTLLVSISRNSFINMPSSERKASFCRDYADSRFHRYKIAGSKNFQHMFPPSATLHLSNLSDSVEEGFLKRLFSDQAELVSFKYLGEERRQALTKFKSVEDAVRVLVYHHNENINGRFLKISFSKASIN
jgi:RNA recognition motif-containing protein